MACKLKYKEKIGNMKALNKLAFVGAICFVSFGSMAQEVKSKEKPATNIKSKRMEAHSTTSEKSKPVNRPVKKALKPYKAKDLKVNGRK